MRNYKARGVVLHTIKYGDSSLIAYIFTDIGGRQTYMVQGVHSKKRGENKAAILQPMFLIEFEGVEPTRGQMHRMKDTRTFVSLKSLPFDVRKSTISLFMAEVLYKLIREVEANEPLFDFICQSVTHLDLMNEGISNFHLWFLVQLSVYLGFYPGNEYVPGSYFDIKSGLFCAHIPSHQTFMSEGAARLLGRLMECEPEQLSELQLSRVERVEFMESILAFFGYHFDSINSINSIAILREVF